MLRPGLQRLRIVEGETPGLDRPPRKPGTDHELRPRISRAAQQDDEAKHSAPKKEKDGKESRPPRPLHELARDRCGRRLLLTPHRRESIHQPGRRNHEQRGEKEPEEGVEPNERDIEAAEAEPDPQRSKRTVTFQATLLTVCLDGKYSHDRIHRAVGGRVSRGYLANR